jgi:tetratricopeptide (TPR) repeat protein
MVPSPAATSGFLRSAGAVLIAPLLCAPLWFATLAILEEREAQAAPAAGAAADKQAREHFQNAENSFNLGRFPDALADYQAAYEAKPLPGFLFNIAQCYRNMQSYDRARFFFRRYLALDPKTPNRRLVEDLIAEMTRELDKAEKAAAKAEKSDKSEQSDDQATPPVDVAVAAAPASAPVLTPPPPPPPAPAPAPAPVPALALESHPPPPAESPPIYKRWWFWTGAGAVVAAGVIVAIFALRSEDPQGSLGTIKGRSPGQ